MDLAETLERAERHLWSDERGSMEFVRLREGVGLLVMSGKLGDEAAKAWELHFPWLLGRGQVSLFMDGAGVTLPNAAFISAGTSLIKGVRPRLDALHVLVDGALLEMTAKTANIALGGLMRITRERNTFEAELARALG
ncbi:MAG TPA: hypothetical protein VK034_21930 [Enhygromyxa sp.]|nr:hypothetical protein [Enhygromyxa sp.]